MATTSEDTFATQVAWAKQQEDLSSRAVLEDTVDVSSVRFIGGCDLTFSAIKPNLAYACIVVVARGDLKPLVIREKLVSIDVPFIPGYLAFREAPVLEEIWRQLREDSTADPTIPFPDVILLDGNGIMHPRKCGVATHLGVLLGVPTIGVAKTYFQVDGIASTVIREATTGKLSAFGDWMRIVGTTMPEWGAVVRTTVDTKKKPSFSVDAGYRGDIHGTIGAPVAGGGAPDDSTSAEEDSKLVHAESSGCKPVFVSIGSGISLRSALQFVLEMCRYRVPEPTRIADKQSRTSMKGWDAALAKHSP